ncbi:MAG: tRNA pseudouridine(38-40) synthase TruA [Bradymonadales bacterium]|jgi:tRNA pseudouridine38-40 synthase
MQRIALIVAYDGTAYSGWQRQRDVPSVQEALETALSKIHGGKPVLVMAASRTDAGVHAQYQIAYFDSDRAYDEERWKVAINATTPWNIQVRRAYIVAADFNPRSQNNGKHYRYLLWEGFTLPPSLLKYAVSCPPLDIERMREGAQHFVGTHNFSAFRAYDCQAAHAIRTIYDVSIERKNYIYEYPLEHEENSLIQIDVKGTAFLKQMVRIMVGSLLDVGLGKQKPAWIADLLEKGQRSMAGQTMPPQALCLLKIFSDLESESPAT